MLIVIEGSSDGIGKSTQLKLLNEYLEKMKKDVIMFHFPSYNEISSFMINTYLDGKLGNVDNINPYVVSSFYAIDRYLCYENYLKKALDCNKIVILDRYIYILR